MVWIIFTTYRRGKLESGDIDVLLTHPSYTSTDGNARRSQLLKKVVNSLVSKKLIIDTISLGDVKFMVSLFSVRHTILFTSQTVKLSARSTQGMSLAAIYMSSR
jgi:hypothetical protein